MFHFSNAKMNTCPVSVPATEAASCCASSQENTALALTMDAIILASIFVMLVSILMVLRLSALVILCAVIIPVIIISIIIPRHFSLGLKPRF